MSFQGDVRGIGLAELLQGLARGRKQGVVSLSARGRERLLIGLADGRAYLLPGEDESEERWQEVVRDAWLDVPGTRLESLHVGEVARARRLEALYALLDGDGAHFRFEPRNLSIDAQGNVQWSPSHGPIAPVPIESLLLEYARIADEWSGLPAQLVPTADDVPTLVQGSSLTGAISQQVDGRSTTAEIGDRLGWTLRQTRLAIGTAVAHGQAQLLPPDHLLILGIQEFKRQAWERAARRLSVWTTRGSALALSAEVLEHLANEWSTGRLVSTLRRMEAQDVWTFLIRWQRRTSSPQMSLQWAEAARIFPEDGRFTLRCLACEAADETSQDTPTFNTLLGAAAQQARRDTPWRALPLLRLAEQRGPTSHAERLELGQLFLAAGAAETAAPWLLAACEELIDRRISDRAVPILRELYAALPQDRDVRTLLGRARRSSGTARKLRRRLGIGLAACSIVAAGGVVQGVARHQRAQDLQYVRSLLSDPLAAEAALHQAFEDPQAYEDAKVLLAQIHELQRVQEVRLRDEWEARFAEVHAVSREGSPLEALALARALPTPPRLRHVTSTFSVRTTLFEDIGRDLGEQLRALGPVRVADLGQRAGEDAIEERLASLRIEVGTEPASEERLLLEQLSIVQSEIEARRAMRQSLASDLEAHDLRALQSELYERAMRLDHDNRFAEAVVVLEELFGLDSSGELRGQLADEVLAPVVSRADAYAHARDLADSGRYAEARATLGRGPLEKREGLTLPVHVTSTPAGAWAALDTDQEPRATPFVLEVLPKEQLRLSFELEGYEPAFVQLEGPAQVAPILTRTPARRWVARSVDAAPLPIGPHHLVADRHGDIALLGPEATVLWRKSLDSLSGIKRSLQVVPGSEGLVAGITEDGVAFVLEIDGGELRSSEQLGPRLRPVAGPRAEPSGVVALLSDGSIAQVHPGGTWTIQTEPKERLEADPGATNGLHIVKQPCRLEGAIASPYMSSPWKASWEDETWTLADGAGHSFTIHCPGSRASWLAFEHRRGSELFWLSDESGLRAWELVSDAGRAAR